MMFKLLTIAPTTIFKLLVKNIAIALVISLIMVGYYGYSQYQARKALKYQLTTTQANINDSNQKLSSISAELEKLKNEDQVKKNQQLQDEIRQIHDTYQKSVSTYESIKDLESQAKKDYPELENQWTESVKLLSDRKLSDASNSLDKIIKSIDNEKAKLAPPPPPPPGQQTASATTTNPPGTGYQRISVPTDRGTFTVDIVSADLNSTKVLVDTASDSDCVNNCPVMPLGNYASRSGAWAAIAGPFFCPASYPSCAGKTNSFDTLLMNKNKHYFNSDNNVYSAIPAAIFSAGSARFVSRSLEWGRDTSPDSVIANFPLLVAGGNIVYSGSSDSKLNSKGPRGFIASKGSKVFMGYVSGADTADSAAVMKTLGMDSALNLDEGGSTALWVGGKYILGPGRDLPFGVLLVNR